jgi:hypothetical protein
VVDLRLPGVAAEWRCSRRVGHGQRSAKIEQGKAQAEEGKGAEEVGRLSARLRASLFVKDQKAPLSPRTGAGAALSRFQELCWRRKFGATRSGDPGHGAAA